MTHNSTNSSFAARPLRDLIAAVASDDVSPGAGTAGAVALALAAACAGKAVAITLSHASEDPFLAKAAGDLADIGRRALQGADEDAARFEEFVREQDAPATRRLIRTGEGLQRLAAALDEVLLRIEARIHPVVAGDIAAAGVLRAAAVSIAAHNLDESRNAEPTMHEED